MAKNLELLTGGCVVIAAGAWLVAGPLNPPSGPVSAGGKTTQEIYDAVTNISGSIGSVGGRGPAVPGGNRTQGSFSLTASQGMSFSGPLLGMRFAARTVFSSGGGGSSGQTIIDGCTIVREMGEGSAKAFRLQMTGQAFMTMTAVVPSVGGNTTYTFGDNRVIGLRQYHIQRSDGTMASIEEIDISFVSLTVLDPGGANYTYNAQISP